MVSLIQWILFRTITSYIGKGMFQMKKILAVLILLSVLVCNVGNCESNYLSLNDTFAPDENGVYKDLGNYLIELNYDEADFEAARAYLDKKQGLGDGDLTEDMQIKADPKLAHGGGACTACAKLSPDGEVLIGRNLDNEVSVCPAFIIHTSFGRYPTVSIRFNNFDTYTYEEFKETGYLDKEYMNYIPFCVTDALNSEGLYVEANVREPSERLLNTGTNPDKERVSVNMLVQMIAMNCATVKDVINYLRNEINVVSSPYKDLRTPTQYAYYVGDATGTFGIIEIAQNRVNFIPYQPAQGNFYLTPTWNAIENNGSGYGRMERVLDGLEDVTTLEEMMEQMKKPMWYQHILYFENTYQDENGITRFVDDEGNPVIDWRSDLSNLLPVDETGHLSEHYEDESLYNNSNVEWMMDESHFSEMMEGIGTFMALTGWKEKLVEYYNGNEMPLRESRSVFTTGVSYAVNCAQKTMLVKFWEKEDLVYEISMK